MGRQERRISTSLRIPAVRLYYKGRSHQFSASIGSGYIGAIGPPLTWLGSKIKEAHAEYRSKKCAREQRGAEKREALHGLAVTGGRMCKTSLLAGDLEVELRVFLCDVGRDELYLQGSVTSVHLPRLRNSHGSLTLLR